MPNVQAILCNTAPNLVTIWYPGGTLSVTSAEAQTWIDQHAGATDAQIEAQINTLIAGRWTGRVDTVAVHLISRVPLAISVWVGNPGATPPAVWW